MKERNKAVPCVYLILYKNGKILLGKRKNTGYRDGDWNLPSGHIEAGELPKEAMIREAKEEIGINLLAEDIEFAHLSYRPKHDETGDRIDIFFFAENWEGEPTNSEPHKCSEIAWWDGRNLPPNMPPHVRRILEMLDQEFLMFSEFGIDFLKKHGAYMLDK